MLLRPSASHTCGKAVGEIVTRLCGWFPVQKSGGVTWYKSSERCHESPHVHTPWNPMSQQGRGRELSYPMLDNHLKLDFYFLVVGRTSMLNFPAQKSWNKSPYFILIQFWDCLLMKNKTFANGDPLSCTCTPPKAQGRARSQVENVFAEWVTSPEYQVPQHWACLCVDTLEWSFLSSVTFNMSHSNYLCAYSSS